MLFWAYPWRLFSALPRPDIPTRPSNPRKAKGNGIGDTSLWLVIPRPHTRPYPVVIPTSYRAYPLPQWPYPRRFPCRRNRLHPSCASRPVAGPVSGHTRPRRARPTLPHAARLARDRVACLPCSRLGLGMLAVYAGSGKRRAFEDWPTCLGFDFT